MWIFMVRLWEMVVAATAKAHWDHPVAMGAKTR